MPKSTTAPESHLSVDHQQVERNGIRVASFFSGGGGLDLGFTRAGFDIVFASDIDARSCETLLSNSRCQGSLRPEVRCSDIRTLDLKTVPPDIQVVIGGPPCQSFSASGRRAGGAAGRLDERGTLFEAYIRVIRHLQPQAFLFENVRGIFATNGGRDWKQISSAFSLLGYTLSYRLLDACDYGIPQHRERVLLVGHRLDDDFLFPRPTHGPNSLSKQPYVTPSQAFQDLKEPGQTSDLKLAGGKYSDLLPLVPEGSNYLHFTSTRGYPNPIFAYRSRFSDFLYKSSPTQPTKTIIASPGKYTGPFHWSNRRFSIAEYKALQGFPQAYDFVGNRAEIVRQIGNSVSPLLAEQLAHSIASQVFHVKPRFPLLPAKETLSFDSRKGKAASETRARHARIAVAAKGGPSEHFRAIQYRTSIAPQRTAHTENVCVKTQDQFWSRMSVHSSDRGPLALSTTLLIGDQEDTLFPTGKNVFRLDVELYGDERESIHTMWNAVDDWVIRSSNFHSLFELYGHFTEPHPIFTITRFDVHSSAPIFEFAKHISDFSNCSRYFPKVHLTEMFGDSFHTTNFLHLTTLLRALRFDIRCHETNVAISPEVYMVCYPFTLPFRRQMNFTLREQSLPFSDRHPGMAG